VDRPPHLELGQELVLDKVDALPGQPRFFQL
jgi:hypothetical protein